MSVPSSFKREKKMTGRSEAVGLSRSSIRSRSRAVVVNWFSVRPTRFTGVCFGDFDVCYSRSLVSTPFAVHRIRPCLFTTVTAALKYSVPLFRSFFLSSPVLSPSLVFPRSLSFHTFSRAARRRRRCCCCLRVFVQGVQGERLGLALAVVLLAADFWLAFILRRVCL